MPQATDYSNYIVWDADPVIFDLGVIQLPFPITIWGIVLAFILIFFGYSKIKPETAKTEDVEPSAWKLWALIIGSFIVGQLIFLVLPSPAIEQIGPIQPRWYGALFAGAFVFGYYIMFRIYRNAGLTQEDLDQLLFYVLFATIIGARLGHVLFYDIGFYLRNPAEILAIWHGGLASHGAAVGILLAMYFYVKKYSDMSFLWLADRVVVVVASGGAFIRTGNFINSEIVGEPTNLPWGIIFARRTDLEMVPRHPTMLYEAVLCIVVFAILWGIYKYYKNNPPEGVMFGPFLILLFGGRFLLEFTKINQAAFASEWAINMGQWLSIPLIIAGVWLVFSKVDWKNPPKQKVANSN